MAEKIFAFAIGPAFMRPHNGLEHDWHVKQFCRSFLKPFYALRQPAHLASETVPTASPLPAGLPLLAVGLGLLGETHTQNKRRPFGAVFFWVLPRFSVIVW